MKSSVILANKKIIFKINHEALIKFLEYIYDNHLEDYYGFSYIRDLQLMILESYKIGNSKYHLELADPRYLFKNK